MPKQGRSSSRKRNNRRRRHQRGGNRNSADCPYSDFSYKCPKKSWCVKDVSHCRMTSSDILLTQEKAFRRPLKRLLEVIVTKATQLPEFQSPQLLAAAKDVADAVDNLLRKGVVPDLNNDVVTAINRLENQANTDDITQTVTDLMSDLEFIKKAYGEATILADEKLQEGEEVVYDIEELTPKEILAYSMRRIDDIQEMLGKVNSNLEAIQLD